MAEKPKQGAVRALQQSSTGCLLGSTALDGCQELDGDLDDLIPSCGVGDGVLLGLAVPLLPVLGHVIST